jgi:hypothetical protein
MPSVSLPLKTFPKAGLPDGCNPEVTPAQNSTRSHNILRQIFIKILKNKYQLYRNALKA